MKNKSILRSPILLALQMEQKEGSKCYSLSPLQYIVQMEQKEKSRGCNFNQLMQENITTLIDTRPHNRYIPISSEFFDQYGFPIPSKYKNGISYPDSTANGSIYDRFGNLIHN